jgi:hypothetical protein|tara:strand:+ start:2885 stop:5176 length:2292 start_codon:yes stop_codon:yes gene_type:complete
MALRYNFQITTPDGVTESVISEGNTIAQARTSALSRFPGSTITGTQYLGEFGPQLNVDEGFGEGISPFSNQVVTPGDPIEFTPTQTILDIEDSDVPITKELVESINLLLKNTGNYNVSNLTDENVENVDNIINTIRSVPSTQVFGRAAVPTAIAFLNDSLENREEEDKLTNQQVANQVALLNSFASKINVFKNSPDRLSRLIEPGIDEDLGFRISAELEKGNPFARGNINTPFAADNVTPEIGETDTAGGVVEDANNITTEGGDFGPPPGPGNEIVDITQTPEYQALLAENERLKASQATNQAPGAPTPAASVTELIGNIGDPEFQEFLSQNQDILFTTTVDGIPSLTAIGEELINNYNAIKEDELNKEFELKQQEIRDNQVLSEIEKQIELQEARLDIEREITKLETDARIVESNNQFNIGIKAAEQDRVARAAQATQDRIARAAVAETQAGTSPFFGLEGLTPEEQDARRRSQLAGTGGVFGALAAGINPQDIFQAQRDGLSITDQLALARASGNPFDLDAQQQIALQTSLARGGLTPDEQIALARATANPFGFTAAQQIGLQESLARGGLTAPQQFALETQLARGGLSAQEQFDLQTALARGGLTPEQRLAEQRAAVNPFNLTAQEQIDLQTALARGGLSAEERLAEQRLGIVPELFRASPQSLGALSSVLGGTANLRSALNPFLGTNFTGGTATQATAPMSTPTLGQYQQQTPFQQGATQANLASTGQDIEQAILGVTPQGVNTNPGGLAPFTSTIGTY